MSSEIGRPKPSLLCNVARIVIDWLPLTNILVYSQNHLSPSVQPGKVEIETGIDHRKPAPVTISVATHSIIRSLAAIIKS